MSSPAVAAIALRRSQSQPTSASGDRLHLSTVLPALAVAEFIADKLPFIPDRRKPPAFAWRIASGALSAAAVASKDDNRILAAAIGAAGAAAGTFGGSALRARLAAAFGHDLPAALTEDALVLALAVIADRGLNTIEERLPIAA
ncbi:MAG TPA: hypothetical protein VGJ21_03770 [Terracidiphilus sp.]